MRIFGWFLFYFTGEGGWFWFFKGEISAKTDYLMSHIYSRLPVSEPIVEANPEILSGVVSDLQREVLVLNRERMFFPPLNFFLYYTGCTGIYYSQARYKEL